MKPQYPQKYTSADITEDKGKGLLGYKLDPNHFLLVDFSALVGKDRHPGIDGLVRLRDGNGVYLNKYLLFQLKSTEVLKDKKYPCDKELIDFVITANVPTLIFVADVKEEKLYWHLIEKDEIEKLRQKKKTKGMTIDLSDNEVTKKNSIPLLQQWYKFAETSNYKGSKDNLDEISAEYRKDASRIVALVYLLQAVSKEEALELFSKAVGLPQDRTSSILRDLLKGKLLIETPKLYLLENDDLGVECLFDYLEELELENLRSVLSSKAHQKKFLERLTGVEHPKVANFLKKIAKKFIEEIEAYSSKDEVSDAIEMLHTFVTRVPKLGIKAIKALLKDQSNDEKYKYNYTDFREKAIGVLGRIRYLETKEVVKILLPLALSRDEKVANRAKDELQHISKYNLNILNKVGYYAQFEVIDLIERWKTKSIRKYFYPALILLKPILLPSFEGRDWSDYKTLTIRNGALPPSIFLVKLRKRAISQLIKMYEVAPDLMAKREIIRTLIECTKFPLQGGLSEEIENMVFNDASQLIDWYLELLPSLENEVIKEIEHSLYGLERRFQKRPLKKLEELKGNISQRLDYQIFRVLVGHDVHFSPEMGWREIQKWRSDEVNKFVSEIDSSSYPQWKEIILQILKGSEFEERGEYSYFRKLLFRVGENKPEFAMTLFEQEEDRLQDYKVHLLAGMYESEDNQVESVIAQKMELGCDLDLLVQLFQDSSTIDEQLFKSLVSSALKFNDLDALNRIAIVAIIKMDEYPYLRNIFFKVIRKLNQHQDSRWVFNAWYKWDNFAESFTEQEAMLLLKSTLYINRIDYHLEEILGALAKQFPEKLVWYFEKRILIQKEKGSIEFDAIPFQVHNKLREALVDKGQVIIPLVMKWFKKKGWQWQWEGSHLLANLYNLSNPTLNRVLRELVDSGVKANFKIFIAVLRGYKESDVLLELCEYFLVNVEKSNKYYSNLYSTLSQVGVVSGEYGVAKAYDQKSKLLTSWTTHSNIAVKEFAKKYTKQMQLNAKHERKLATEAILLRKKGLE